MSDTTNHDLLFKSENHTNELADGELDEQELEVINGGAKLTKDRRCQADQVMLDNVLNSLHRAKSAVTLTRY